MVVVTKSADEDSVVVPVVRVLVPMRTAIVDVVAARVPVAVDCVVLSVVVSDEAELELAALVVVSVVTIEVSIALDAAPEA